MDKRFKIYESNKEVQEVALALKPLSNSLGGVKLVAVHPTTGMTLSSGNLLEIDHTGQLYLYGGVAKTLGFKLADALTETRTPRPNSLAIGWK